MFVHPNSLTEPQMPGNPPFVGLPARHHPRCNIAGHERRPYPLSTAEVHPFPRWRLSFLEFVRAIRSVADGDAVIAPSVTRRLLDIFARRIPDSRRPAEATHSELSQLAAREREILIELAGGFSDADR